MQNKLFHDENMTDEEDDQPCSQRGLEHPSQMSLNFDHIQQSYPNTEAIFEELGGGNNVVNLRDLKNHGLHRFDMFDHNFQSQKKINVMNVARQSRHQGQGKKKKSGSRSKKKVKSLGKHQP